MLLTFSPIITESGGQIPAPSAKQRQLDLGKRVRFKYNGFLME
ncbi:hypothetical protein W04_1404 [Pseudoalteromonas sp. SW0106-04]|nr:hypothetical protein W04_1404 [Pseudoalteromonas sp. SW0106-04]